MQLRAGAATEKGLGRERNEDVYVLQVAQGLFVVCDGIGGAAAGDIASQMAAATILHELQQPAAAANARAMQGHHRPETYRLVDAVRESNRLIYHDGQQNPDRREMGTTVVSAWLQHEIASVAHVGDSRAYLWRDHCLEPLTQDHTLSDLLAREGLEASADDLQEDPRDILVRVVGGEPDVEVDVAEIALRSGDYLVLCSDGLSRMVSDTIVSASISRLRHPQHICNHLVRTVTRHGGPDDTTVLIVEVVEAGAV